MKFHQNRNAKGTIGTNLTCQYQLKLDTNQRIIIQFCAIIFNYLVYEGEDWRR